MTNSLVPAGMLNNLPVQTGDDSDFEELGKGGKFLQRLSLVSSSGKPLNTGQAALGDYVISTGKDKFQSLGQQIDLLVLYRRPKAIDFSDRKNIVTSFNFKSEVFKDIERRAKTVKDSKCQYGTSFLVIERSTGRMYEFFCGNASGRRVTDQIASYMPITAEQIKARKLVGVKPHSYLPLTMKSELTPEDKDGNQWWVPVVHDCSTPFTADNMPSANEIKAEIEKFEAETREEAGVVKKAEGRRAR